VKVTSSPDMHESRMSVVIAIGGRTIEKSGRGAKKGGGEEDRSITGGYRTSVVCGVGHDASVPKPVT